MGAARKKAEEVWAPSGPPSMTREARQARLENLALDLIEKRLINGDASAQETTLYAKSASTRGRIEELRLQHEIELMKAKKTQIESQEELQDMFTKAIEAMGNYRVETPEGGESSEDVHRTY